MRILHVTKKYPNALGGDAVTVSNLEKKQREHDHEVFIITSNCEVIKNKKNVIKIGIRDTPENLDRINPKRIISLLILFLLGFKKVKKIRPDVIHSHSADMGFMVSFSARLYKIPIINTCHGISFPYDIYSYIKRTAELFFLKFSNFKKIITVDKNSLKFFWAENIRNVLYIPNGVDIDKFKKEYAQKRNQNIKFLFVGRLEEQKGIKYLLYACCILRNKNKNFNVLLVGDGSQRSYIKNLIGKLNLTNNVFLLGKLSDKDLIGKYNESQVFVLPSIWEGLPLTLLEAWAAKLSPIVTNVGGISKVCTNQKNALIIRPKDPDGIAYAMLTLISDKNLREKLGINGRELVEKEYTWDRMTIKLENVYNSVGVAI